MPRRRSVRWPAVAVVVAGVVVLAVAGYVVRSVNTPPADAGQVVGFTPPPVTSPPPLPPPPGPLSVPRGSRVVFFGDSWTSGYNATVPARTAFAPLVGKAFGWRYTLDGRGHTSYATTSTDGANDTYRQRLTDVKGKPRLLIIQGGVNDLGRVDAAYPGTVLATLQEAKRVAQQVVVIGPCPIYRIQIGQLDSIDSTIQYQARRASVHYLSCIREGWLPADLGSVIDEKPNHPNDRGYALIARHVETDLRGFIR